MTESYKLNAYSSTPQQVKAWIAACKSARAMLGNEERAPTSPAERQTLTELKRGAISADPSRPAKPSRARMCSSPCRCRKASW